MSFLVGLNSSGNQINNNIIASNVSVEAFDTFPTTSTGDATGNYNHLGIDGQSNNKWDFLNISGTLDGGFNLWNSSTNHAPYLLTSIDETGLSVPNNATTDKSILTSDTLSLTSSPSFAPTVLSQSGLSLNNGSGNSNELLSTQITLNDTVNNLTNLINPQIVELTDNSGTSSNIQCDAMGFMINDGTIYKTATFSSQSLQIKNWLTNNKVLMTDNSIALNDNTNVNTNVIDKTQISLTNNSNFDNVIISPDSVLVRNTNNSSHVSINNNSVAISNDTNAYSSGLTQTKFFLANNNPSYVQNIQIQQYPDISITSTDGTNTSILTPSNLTINGISYAQNQIVPTLIYSSPVIYADGIAPATSLSIRATYGYSGWYFQNVVAGNKINWYFPPPTIGVTTVADLKGVAMSYFNGVTTTIGSSPFIIVYTVPTGSGDYAPGFYHSSQLYQPPSNPTANTNYQACILANKSTIPFNYETQVQWVAGTTHGTYSQTDKILAVVIGSNSASAVNSCQFVVNKINLIYANFTQSYLLISP